MAKLKVGLIGCGGRGRSHAMGYLGSERAEMVSCVDAVRETGERAAEELGMSRWSLV